MPRQSPFLVASLVVVASACPRVITPTQLGSGGEGSPAPKVDSVRIAPDRKELHATDEALHRAFEGDELVVTGSGWDVDSVQLKLGDVSVSLRSVGEGELRALVPGGLPSGEHVVRVISGEESDTTDRNDRVAVLGPGHPSSPRLLGTPEPRVFVTNIGAAMPCAAAVFVGESPLNPDGGGVPIELDGGRDEGSDDGGIAPPPPGPDEIPGGACMQGQLLAVTFEAADTRVEAIVDRNLRGPSVLNALVEASSKVRHTMPWVHSAGPQAQPDIAVVEDFEGAPGQGCVRSQVRIGARAALEATGLTGPLLRYREEPWGLVSVRHPSPDGGAACATGSFDTDSFSVRPFGVDDTGVRFVGNGWRFHGQPLGIGLQHLPPESRDGGATPLDGEPLLVALACDLDETQTQVLRVYRVVLAPSPADATTLPPLQVDDATVAANLCSFGWSAGATRGETFGAGMIGSETMRMDPVAPGVMLLPPSVVSSFGGISAMPGAALIIDEKGAHLQTYYAYAAAATWDKSSMLSVPFNADQRPTPEFEIRTVSDGGVVLADIQPAETTYERLAPLSTGDAVAAVRFGGRIDIVDARGDTREQLGVLGTPAAVWPRIAGDRMEVVIGYPYALVVVDITGAVSSLDVIGTPATGGNKDLVAATIIEEYGDGAAPEWLWVPAKSDAPSATGFKRVPFASLDLDGADVERFDLAAGVKLVAVHRDVALVFFTPASEVSCLAGTCDPAQDCAHALGWVAVADLARAEAIQCVAGNAMPFVNNARLGETWLSVFQVDHEAWHVFSLRDGTSRAVATTDFWPRIAVPMPNGDLIGVFESFRSFGGEAFIATLSPETGTRVIAEAPFREGGIAVSPDGRRLYAGTHGALLEYGLYDEDGGLAMHVISEMHLSGSPTRISVDPTGTAIVYVDDYAAKIGILR